VIYPLPCALSAVTPHQVRSLPPKNAATRSVSRVTERRVSRSFVTVKKLVLDCCVAGRGRVGADVCPLYSFEPYVAGLMRMPTVARRLEIDDKDEDLKVG
jgi:hypothetical protein